MTRLAEEAGEGRLTAEELDERTQAALAARTTGELEALFADLPYRPRRTSRRRAQESKNALRGHLVAFALVNLLLIAIWAASGAGYFWPIWPLLGWGIGLLSHVRGARRTGYSGPGRPV